MSQKSTKNKNEYPGLNTAIALLLFAITFVGGFVLVEEGVLVGGGGDVLGKEKMTFTTYDNVKHGYAIHYPSGWRVDNITENITWVNSSPYYFDFIRSEKLTSGQPQSAIQLQMRDNPKELEFEEWLNAQKKFPKFETAATALDTGVTVYKVTTQNKDWKARSTYFAKTQEGFLQVSFYSNNDDLAQEHILLYETALDTLKFSFDQKEVIQETYQNGIYGFLVNYPTNFYLSNDDYNHGIAGFTKGKNDIVLEVEFVADKHQYRDAKMFLDSRKERRNCEDTEETKVGQFRAYLCRFDADTFNHYYYTETSQGYFILRVKAKKGFEELLGPVEEEFLNSFQVYELLDASGWMDYSSADGTFTFRHPPNVSITNVHNGVEVTMEGGTIGMYRYENLGLSPTAWVDNAQLNKYKSADSKHFVFSVKSRVDGRDALRVLDPVDEMKLVAYAADKNNVYVIDLKPYDGDTDKIFLFNTILELIQLN
ncbi:hypothetical protein ACFL2D_01845 [Patescibacteria group bacterium]